ncbi:MAG: winged helix-turn-helix domain-containing protein [Paludibacteraceae bacterium]|nr:winged helix-turn-helix domain-containing protein [Paludibacteraceae bacterium]
MEKKVGTNAGLVWQALNGAKKAVEVKDLKKVTKLTEKDLYAAFGWLLREGKISVKEEGKEVFVSLN